MPFWQEYPGTMLGPGKCLQQGAGRLISGDFDLDPLGRGGMSFRGSLPQVNRFPLCH